MSGERGDRSAPRRETPLETVVSDVAGLLTGDSGTSRTFIGGLVVGALVGAAVAGASLVRSRAAASAWTDRLGRKG